MILILKIKNIFAYISMCSGENSLEGFKAKDRMTADSFEFVAAGNYKKPIMYSTCQKWKETEDRDLELRAQDLKSSHVSIVSLNTTEFTLGKWFEFSEPQFQLFKSKDDIIDLIGAIGKKEREVSC